MACESWPRSLNASDTGDWRFGTSKVTAAFLYGADAETPLNFREEFRSFSRKNLENFSGWILKPQFWYPPLRFGSQHRIPKHLFFLVFWVFTADFDFSAGRRKVSDIFLRCLSRNLGSQHQLRVKTRPSYKRAQDFRSKPQIFAGDRRFSQTVGDRYDWTAGKPYDGHEWRKYRIVPRAPLASLCVFACFNRSGSKGAFKISRGEVGSLPWHSGTFARSCSVSRLGSVTLDVSPFALP